MKRFSLMKKQFTANTVKVCLLIMTLMLSLGLSSAQAKDRISYLHSDISGSPIAATDANGELLWEESYKPYGERLTNADTNNQLIRIIISQSRSIPKPPSPNTFIAIGHALKLSITTSSITKWPFIARNIKVTAIK